MRDILLGKVWLASGQSNMECVLPVGKSLDVGMINGWLVDGRTQTWLPRDS